MGQQLGVGRVKLEVDAAADSHGRPTALAKSLRVAFVTDVEGNWEYFNAFVALSECLEIVATRPDGSLDLRLAEGWHFIHGGDCVDKGGAIGGSVRVVRTLVALKRKYPDRVTLILGNRDVNKMRLTSELAEAQLLDERLAEIPGPYWDARAPSPREYLRQQCAAQQGVAAEEVTEAQVLAQNTLVNRVKWMLKCTMGAEGELQRRVAELTAIRRIASPSGDGGAVSEEDAALSFVDSVRRGGFMDELLELGQLAVVVHSALFVHGGLMGNFAGGERSAFGYVPGRAFRITDDVSRWVSELNEWKGRMIAEWRLLPEWRCAWVGGVCERRSHGGGGGVCPHMRVRLDGGQDTGEGLGRVRHRRHALCLPHRPTCTHARCASSPPLLTTLAPPPPLASRVHGTLAVGTAQTPWAASTCTSDRREAATL